MSEQAEAASLVLAGIIPGQVERLSRSLWLDRSMFDQVDGYIWNALLVFYRQYRTVAPTEAVKEALLLIQDENPDRASAVARRWIEVRDMPCSDEQFDWAVMTLFTSWRDVSLAVACRDTGAILGPGAVVGGERRQGFDDAVSHLSSEIRRLESFAQDSVPESVLSGAYQEIMADYGTAQTHPRIRLQIDALDDPTSGGMAPGELWLVCGYAGEGKSLFATTVVAREAILQGKNVVYATGETLIPLCYRRLVTRHTRSPVVAQRYNTPGGVDIMAVKAGTLTPEHYAAYQFAAQDLTSNPDYGKLVTLQMPMRTTTDWLMERVSSYAAEFPIDVLVVDSLDMLRRPRLAGRRNEDISDVIEDLAALAINHDGGRGLVVVSPYQMNRAGFDKATADEGQGRYSLNDLADTVMAERRAFLILSLLRRPGQHGELFAQILKNRDGPTSEFKLDLDDRSAYVGPGANLASTGGDSMESYL